MCGGLGIAGEQGREKGEGGLSYLPQVSPYLWPLAGQCIEVSHMAKTEGEAEAFLVPPSSWHLGLMPPFHPSVTLNLRTKIKQGFFFILPLFTSTSFLHHVILFTEKKEEVI